MTEQRPNLDSPFTTWTSLPKDVREEVVRLALAGRPHPDTRVARLAGLWAADISKQHTWGMMLGAAMTALSGGAGDLRREFREREQARAIIAVGEPV
jgi:hypothetical protein